jgi:hypothetical protein
MRLRLGLAVLFLIGGPLRAATFTVTNANA